MSNLNYNYPNLISNGGRNYSISKIGEKGGNTGFLTGKNAMPMKFNPSNGSNLFSMNRNIFNRTGGQKNYLLNNKPKMTNNMDSSQLTHMKKYNNIGKVSKYNNGNISFSNNNKNDVKKALSKVRSGGCVVPKKINIY